MTSVLSTLQWQVISKTNSEYLRVKCKQFERHSRALLDCSQIYPKKSNREKIFVISSQRGSTHNQYKISHLPTYNCNQQVKIFKLIKWKILWTKWLLWRVQVQVSEQVYQKNSFRKDVLWLAWLEERKNYRYIEDAVYFRFFRAVRNLQFFALSFAPNWLLEHYTLYAWTKHFLELEKFYGISSESQNPYFLELW